ncbi:cytochrome P450 [Tricladium varicosporioides]|nr:cytochrome P450 [Hymenoscyphus varicosporioides]
MLLYYLAWRQVLQVALSILVAYWFYQRFCSARGIPQSIPWAGVDDKGVRARILATARSLFGTRGLLEEAYRKYGKEGIPFVLPNVISGPEVVVPQSMMDWLLHHPDNVLDQAEVNRDFLQADYTMLHPKVIHDAVHSDYIRKELTKNLGEYTGDVLEEIDYAFRKCWGTDSENWTCVVAYDSMSEIIARISNRVLVGLPLCRDENYLYSSSRFARWVILEASRDYIQFCLDNANDARDPDERGSGMISKRLSAISFAAIQSSVITSCNLILDLAASPLTPVVLSTIKQEVLTELKEEGGSWTKGFLSRIVTCDSVLRESMRLWGFVSRGVLKTVVAKEGVDLPGYGRIPCGTKIGVHAYPVHHDDKIYPQANTFQPFRFCKLGDTVTTDDGTMVQQKHVSTPLVTTSNNWMAFSHGKHAW